MTKKRRTGALTIAVLTALAVVTAWGFGAFSGEDGSIRDDLGAASVMRGPLRINVVERGNLEAADSVTLKSEIEGQTAVLWLIEEGTEVKPGELLAELDTANLVDRSVQQEIQVQNSEATFIKAEQSHAIQLSQNESDIANAMRELEFSHIDLEKYLEGDLPQDLQKKEEDILLADEDLILARQNYSWSEKLHEMGFLEQTQLDADRISETRATVKLKQAQRAKALFVDYEIPRRTKELEAGVEEKVRELERVKLQATARVADFEANVRTAQAKFDLEKSELEKVTSQIGKARIVAPVGGMVVYAIDDRSRWGDGEPMQEGAEVRERQDIITIPRSDGFVAEASLHESVLEKVKTGMPCIVSIDALREETFAGVVSYKALLPDQQSRWMNPDLRVYRTTIQLLEADARMRPGMSCSIEILVEELEDVTYVPVQAVFLNAGETICLVVNGQGKPEKRPVTAGQSNGKWVEIQSGLSEGEMILLALPQGTDLEPAPEGASSETRGPPSQARPQPGSDHGGQRPSAPPTSGDAPKSEGKEKETVHSANSGDHAAPTDSGAATSSSPNGNG